MPETEATPRREATLESLLAERTTAAVRHAVHSGDVPQDEIDRLGRLARLVELQKATVSNRNRPSWRLALMATGTLAIVSILLFARVKRTEVELEIHATDVGFSLPTRQVLMENVTVQSLGASGLAGVRLPDPLDRLLQDTSTRADGEVAIRLLAVHDASQRGAISIGALIPDGDAYVWLRRGDRPAEYRLSLRDPRVDIQVDLLGPVQVSLAGAPTRIHDFSNPGAVLLRPAPGIVDLDLTFLDLDRPGLTPQVPISNLTFSRVDEFADRGGSIVRRLSTIRSGTLYLESLNGEQRQLRPGEALRFSEVTGEIRMVRLEADHLTLNFHGWVRGMQTGSEASPHSLMPTWLEWLRARHGLSLLWGTTMYLFGLVTAAVRWLKVSL